MKETVIVDLGVIPYGIVQEYLEKSSYNILLIGKKSQLQQYQHISVKNEIYDYDEIVEDLFANCAYNEKYTEIYSAIVNDYRTLLIAERCNIRYGFRSNHNDMAKIDRMIGSYLSFFENKNIKFVFFQACPHALYSWVFANVAEHLGIKVYFTINSIFYWRNILVEGIHVESIVKANVRNDDDYLAIQYMENVNKKYIDAQPEYEKKRMQKRKKSLLLWNDEIKAIGKCPKKIMFLPFKYKLYKSLLSNTKIPDLKEKYVILFLHYQPERTSLPEGRLYANQIHIINTIYRALPHGWKLYVKEHPATFTNALDYDPRYRDLNFYKYISQLPNTVLVDLGVDSFSLIDNCQCLATITGTVGGEGLLRGKPVLTFGNASYREHKYVYDVNSVEDLVNAFNEIQTISNKEVKDETYKRYVPYILNNSISGIDTLCMSIDESYSEEVRNLSIGRCLGYLIKNASKIS